MRNRVITIISLLALVLAVLPVFKINAAQLTGAKLTLSDSRPSQASTSYTFTISNVTGATAIGCVKVTFDTQANGGGSKPTGMNLGSATVDTTASTLFAETGYTINKDDTNGILSYAHSSAGVTPSTTTGAVFEFDSITNGNTAETTYYAIFETYSNINCSAGLIDSVTVTFIYVNGQVVTATVDPSLTFTLDPKTSGTVNGATINVTSTDGTIPFGTVAYNTPKIAAHTATVATNADGGYSVTVRYTGQLASANHNWTDHSGTNASPATWTATDEAFGYTTSSSTLSGTNDRFTSSGGNKWAGFSSSTPGEVGYKSGPTSSAETFDIGYQVSTGAATPAGSYTTTIVIVATPTY